MASQIRVGRVIGNKMAKTVTVEIETLRHHPLYRKTIRYHKRVMAHDEDNRCQVGDLVKIIEIRPLSKMKHWRVLETVRPATGLAELVVPVEEELLIEGGTHDSD